MGRKSKRNYAQKNKDSREKRRLRRAYHRALTNGQYVKADRINAQIEEGE